MTYNILPASRRGRRTVKAAAFAIALSLPLLMGSAMTSAATGVNCNGVFTGLTPADPIQLGTSSSSAVTGTTITHTISWTPTGVSTVDLVDCFRVDDGSNAALNALVESLSLEYTGANDGSETFTLVIPNDPALVGHTIYARVKCTKGCVESKSGFFAIPVVAPTPDPDPSDTPTPDPDPSDTPTPDPDPSDTPTPDPDPSDTPDPDPSIIPDPDPSSDPDPVDTPDDDTVVRPRIVRRDKPADTLATTGAETTAAWVGVLFITAGVLLRGSRRRPIREAYAGSVPAAGSPRSNGWALATEEGDVLLARFVAWMHPQGRAGPV